MIDTCGVTVVVGDVFLTRMSTSSIEVFLRYVPCLCVLCGSAEKLVLLMMKKILYILLLTVLLGACASRTGSKDGYFPPAVFDSRADWNRFIEIWYSGHLQALEEEPLPKRSSDKESEVYRFTCLRTFHQPFSIRVDVVKGGGGILVRKLSSSHGGYDPGTLKERHTMDLSQKATETLRQAMDRVGFWDMPTTKRETVGSDGSQWIVEAVLKGRYHVVDRRSPEPDTEIRGLGEYFLSLAAWKPDELY